MNWFDFVIIAIVVLGAIQGMRVGMLGAAVTAIGVIIGWLIAGQLADKVGGIFDNSLTGDTIVTVVSYIVIMAVTLVIIRFVWKILKPILTVVTLGMTGMVDRLGGLALGSLFGIVMAGAAIIVVARFAYNFEVPEDGVTGSVAQRIPRVDDTKESVENALTDSAIVSAFIDVTDAIPGDALGFVPSDFRISLDILEKSIEEGDSS